MAYEALYRRYRPATFSQIAGQTHVVATLRNAVESNRVGHAYMFSGPRGTGKTSSARILAKALNCTNLSGGEPCNECESCKAFGAGTSYDLHELDAASNNGVDAMRDLIGKVALGSPGRTKVYILDEVHMLSSGAENALLKTLEEPPSHVVFVLCTTEPNKVVATIRSRTQQLNFSLLSSSEILGLVDYVAQDAGLTLSETDRQYVVRAGGGSARDTLSALDRVVAAGGAPEGGQHFGALIESLGSRDAQAALAAIDGALRSGRDIETVASELLHELRTIFLVQMRANLDTFSEMEIEQAKKRAASFTPARVTRAMESIGQALISMRRAPDPRVDLEVAVIRLASPSLDTDIAALVARVEALEQGSSPGPTTAAPAPSAGYSQTPPQQGQVPAQQPHAQPHHSQPQQAPPVQGRPSQAQPQRLQQGQHRQSPPAQQHQPQSKPSGVAAARAFIEENRRKTQASKGATGPAQSRPRQSLADVQRSGQHQQHGQQPKQHPPKQHPPQGQPPQPQQVAPQQHPPPQQPTPQQTRQQPQQAAPQQYQSHGQPSQPQQVAPQQHQTHGQSSQQQPRQQPQHQQPQPQQQPQTPQRQTSQGQPKPELTPQTVAEAWPAVLATLPDWVKTRYRSVRLIPGRVLQLAAPNPVLRERCEQGRSFVEQALFQYFSQPVAFELIVETTAPEPAFMQPDRGPDPEPDPEPDDYYESEMNQPGHCGDSPVEEQVWVDHSQLEDAPDAAVSGLEQVMEIFQDSTVVEPPEPPAH